MKTEFTVKLGLVLISLVLVGSLAAALSQSAYADWSTEQCEYAAGIGADTRPASPGYRVKVC